MRLLLIEDSGHLQKPLVQAFKSSGYAVDTASDGEEGLWNAQTYEFDVIILDLMLPKLDGLSVLTTIRNEGNQTPVLILSAKDSVEQRIEGLQAGADDYLIKPFALEELLARVEVLSRRGYQNRNPLLKTADLELDTVKKKAFRSGQELDLAPKQYALLEYMMLKSGQVVSRTEIEQHIYDSNAQVMSNVIDSAISGLRKAITINKDSKPLIHTRRGHGYILEED